MKKLIRNRKNVLALLGVVLVFSIAWNANAQQLSLLAAKQGLEEQLIVTSKKEIVKANEELLMDSLEIEIEEIPTVTLINKFGEVVAVLYGEKNALKELLKDKLSKSYFVSSYGKHEIYLIN